MKKGMVPIGCLALLAVLTGCGDKSENVDNGMQCIRELNYQGALECFDTAEQSAENIRLIERGRGIAYMGLTDYEQAADCFRSSLLASDGVVEPIDFDLNYYLAAAYMKSGQNQQAKEVYDAVLALRPEEEDAYFLRGTALLGLSDYDGARADFDKVIEMSPKNYDRLVEIYQALEHYGYAQEGQSYLQSALESGESQMNSYDKGRIYYYLGQYQQAYLALEDAREKGGAESYLYLGKSYEATGDYNYATSVYNSYLSKFGDAAEVYNQLGLCEMAKKDYRSALTAFQAGKQLEDASMMQTLSFNEIVAYEYLGEYKKAAVLLDGYLQSYPDDETAKREKQFLQTR